MKSVLKILAIAAIATQLAYGATMLFVSGSVVAAQALKQAPVDPPGIEALISRVSLASEQEIGTQLFARGVLHGAAGDILNNAGKGLENDVKVPWTEGASVSALPDSSSVKGSAQAPEKLVLHSPLSASRERNLGKRPVVESAGSSLPWSQSSNAGPRGEQGMFSGSYGMPSDRVGPEASEREVIESKLRGAPGWKQRGFKGVQSSPQARNRLEEHPSLPSPQPGLEWNGRPIADIRPFVPKAELLRYMSAFSGDGQVRKLTKHQIRRQKRRDARAKREASSQDEQSQSAKEKGKDSGAVPERHVPTGKEPGALTHKMFNSPELLHADKLFWQGHILDTGYAAALEAERLARQALNGPAFRLDEYVKALDEKKKRMHAPSMTKEQLANVEPALAARLERKNARYIKYLQSRMKAVLEGRLGPDVKPEASEAPAAESSAAGDEPIKSDAE